ncbi:MAG: T9SS type A sorting domain-containing protein [Bacteroidota bacterium]
MKKFIFILTILLNSVVYVSAQEVISAAGETKSAAEYEVSWTLGEPVIATGSSGNYSVTQGFHQPKLTVTSTQIFADDLTIEVYPNPTHEFVLIHSSQLLENAEYALFSLSGEKLMVGKITSKITKLNIESRASGSYLLKLSGENSRPLQTFKIVKR